MAEVLCLGARANPRQVKSQSGRARGQEKSEDVFCRFSEVPHCILPEVIPLGEHELGQEEGDRWHSKTYRKGLVGRVSRRQPYACSSQASSHSVIPHRYHRPLARTENATLQLGFTLIIELYPWLL